MEMKEIPIDQIIPNPLQPREIFDKEKLKELAATIAAVRDHSRRTPLEGNADSGDHYDPCTRQAAARQSGDGAESD